MGLMGKNAPRVLLSVLWLISCAGCATYSKSFKNIEKNLAAGRPAKALEILDEQERPDRDELLYLLNRAMVLRIAGDFSSSNEEFEKAKVLIEKLSAASVTEKSSSFLLNDTTTSYEGAPFEQVLIYLYSALNYLQTGDLSAARVEALQVDVKLQELSGENSETLFNTDPFARYLAGLIYEELGERSDAMISFRKAFEGYRAHNKIYRIAVPSFLKTDLIRLTEQMGLAEELKTYRDLFGIKGEVKASPLLETGEVVVVFNNGLAPIKRERVEHLPDPLTGHILTVALPAYEKKENIVSKARVRAGARQAESEPVEDIDSLAVKTLDANLPAITAKTIARVASRMVVREAVKDKSGKAETFAQNQAINLLFDVVNTLAERADTRSWLTLPAEIQLARLALPPGKYGIKLDLLDSTGGVVETVEFPDVLVEKGRRTYLSYHWIPSQ